MIYRIVVCDGNGPGTDIYGPDAEMAVLNPHLEIELNSAGSLEFTLPVENVNWNVPNVFQNEIEVWEDDKIIWFGRPLQIIRDWNNQRRVVCEGALSYFNDSIQRTWEQQPTTNKTNISFFRHLINGHNNDVMNNKNFIADNITIESTPAYRKTDYDTTLDCLQNMCLAVDGGYFILRKEYIWDVVQQKDIAQRYIDWYEELPDNAMQDVQFGVNLLDISQDLNGADICTVLIVSGKDDVMLNELGNKNPDSNNGVGHDAGSDEIYYAPGTATYGRIVQQKSWNDYSDINELWRKAKTWLIEKNTDIPTIECSAADLYYINNPDMVVDGPLQVGMKVQVISAPHDFNKQLLMYKISMDLDSGVKKVTLGTPPKKELTDIVAPSSGGSSTSGGKGAAGGSSESGSGSGSGSQTVIAPVQDVKVKWPDTDVYTSVVKKKTAKIDLTEVGKVLDVKVDGTSVVSNKIANITIPVKDVKQDGNSVVDANGSANITTPVKDVKVDGQTVVDANGFAQLLSTDFGRVKGILVNGSSIVNPETGIATLNGYVDGYQVTFEYMHHIYYWQKQIIYPSGEELWFIQNSDVKSRMNANYDPETKSLNFNLTDAFQRAITWGTGFVQYFENLGSDPEYHNPDDKVDGNYIVRTTFPFTGIQVNDAKIETASSFFHDSDISNFKLNLIGAGGININAKRRSLSYDTIDVEISTASEHDRPNLKRVFASFEGSEDDITYTIEEESVYLIFAGDIGTSTSIAGTNFIEFKDSEGTTISPRTYIDDSGNNAKNVSGSWYYGKCDVKACLLTSGTVVHFKNHHGIRNITEIKNIDLTNALTSDKYNIIISDPEDYNSRRFESDIYTDTAAITIISTVNAIINASTTGQMWNNIRRYNDDLSDYTTKDYYSYTEYEGIDEQNTSGICAIGYDTGSLNERVYKKNQYVGIVWGAGICTFHFGLVIHSIPEYDEYDANYVTDTELNAAIDDAVSTLESNFQDGVDAIYDACVAKGSTPASQSLSDVVQGIMDIPQSGGGGDTIEFTSSSQENSDFDVVSATSTWDATGLSFTSEVST